MPIEKKPFINYTLEEEGKTKQDVISLWLNQEDREKVERLKIILEQERDGTVVKQALEIAYAFLVGDEKTKILLAVLFKNKRNNKRQGTVTYDPFS